MTFFVTFLLSCASEIDDESHEMIRLSYSTAQLNTTRGSVNIQNTTFDQGETANIYITKVADGSAIGSSPNVGTANASGHLDFASTLYYPEGASSDINIRAYYPSTKVTTSSTSFSVEASQVDDADYKKSDLMYAQVLNQAKTSNNVNLEFNHKLSKVIIEAKGVGGVLITGIALRQVYRTIDFTPLGGALGAGTTLADKVTSLNIASSTSGVATLTGAAILPPQSLSGEFLQITTKNGGTSGTATFDLATVKALESGNQYKLEVSVSAANIGTTAFLYEWSNTDGSYYQTSLDGNVMKIIGNIPRYTFSNSENTPTPDVFYGLTKLTLNTDYTLSYVNNIQIGTALVIAEGKAGTAYAGMKAVKAFEIVSAYTKDFDYEGKIVAWECPYSGTYKLEVWGAQGGNGRNHTHGNDGRNGVGGKGGYSYGTITLTQGNTLYICVGGQGQTPPDNDDESIAGPGGAAGFNGGGAGAKSLNINSTGTSRSGGGGGGTDISLYGVANSTEWNTTNHLYSRIIVAGGGGSATWNQDYKGGFGGGEIGGAGEVNNENYTRGTGGTQTSGGVGYVNGEFGIGGSAVDESEVNVSGAGGGGWYGGATGTRNAVAGSMSNGGGGSGYVYTSTTASNYPSGCLLNSNHYLTDAGTIAGDTEFPAPGIGMETGHEGNGYARITLININE